MENSHLFYIVSFEVWLFEIGLGFLGLQKYFKCGAHIYIHQFKQDLTVFLELKYADAKNTLYPIV